MTNFDRRRFIQFTSAVTAGTFALGESFGGNLLGPSTADASDNTSVRLQPAPSELYRVRLEISLEGNVDLPKDPLISKKRERRLPLKATSVIDFEERLTRDQQGLPMAARRYYYTATSDATVDNNSQTSELRKEAKRVIARLSEGPAVLYGEKEFLTHSELELLQEPICSLAIDGLLPTAAVKVGDKWEPKPETLARVLNLDGVQDSSVVGEITAIDATSVKMVLKGRADASVAGVATAIDLAGKLTFDRKSAAIVWFAVALREVREIGLAKPGFEVGATVKFIRQALDVPNAVRETAPIDTSTPIPPAKLLVSFNSEPGLFTTFMNRHWQTLNGSKGLTTLRMIINEKAIAQCDIRELTRMKPGEQLTLEAFQAEIKKSLGERFGEFFEAEEGLNNGGLRTLRAVAGGLVQDIPVQWVFLHFSDDSGRRVAATFTLESSNVEAFAGADAQLANSFEFTKPTPPKQAVKPGSGLDR